MVIALGFFDGVHLGHGGLLSRAAAMAAEMDLCAGALTFDTHPSALLTGQTVPQLSTPANRETLMRRYYGIRRVLTLPFDRQLMNTPWEEFARSFLLEAHNIRGVVCGHDFRFGKQGLGTPEKLEQFCRAHNMAFACIPEIRLDGKAVSSTLIRELIHRGDMETAVRYLGHPHIMTGTVERGHQLGRTLGIPTANVAFPENLAVPARGVYACRVIAGGKQYIAVTNVGTHPTVNETPTPWAEPWILDFDGDLYGQTIEIQFFARLREERKFPSLDAMAEEIRRNAQQTREFFR